MLPIKFKDTNYRQVFDAKERLLIQKKFLFKNLLNKCLLHKNYHLCGIIGLLFLKWNDFSTMKVKTVRRCILTNRSRVAVSKFGISRMAFRELLQFGIIPGSKKAVW